MTPDNDSVSTLFTNLPPLFIREIMLLLYDQLPEDETQLISEFFLGMEQNNFTDFQNLIKGISYGKQ